MYIISEKYFSNKCKYLTYMLSSLATPLEKSAVDM